MEEVNVLQLIADHLQLLGYTTQFDETGVAARHNVRPYFRFYLIPGGIGFLFPFAVGRRATEDRPGLLALLNAINAQNVVTRFYFDNDRLWVSAWYPRTYERISFGTFFDLISQEIATPRFKFPDQVKLYLE